jgi:hypothetical protein
MKAKVLTYYSLFLFYLNLARRNIEMRQIQQSQEAICKVFQSILWSDLSNSRFVETMSTPVKIRAIATYHI